jgi:hypothetical protein
MRNRIYREEQPGRRSGSQSLAGFSWRAQIRAEHAAGYWMMYISDVLVMEMFSEP